MSLATACVKVGTYERKSFLKGPLRPRLELLPASWKSINEDPLESALPDRVFNRMAKNRLQFRRSEESLVIELLLDAGCKGGSAVCPHPRTQIVAHGEM